jgi:short-subunit dehydrogenase
MIGSKNSYALITGASSGMGYDYAKLFAKDGKNIVVLARSRDKLEELKADLEKQHGTKVMVLVKDLSDPKAPQEVLSELERAGISIDVLVNNAGFAVYGNFSESDWQKEAEMLQVNVIALTHLTKLFLPKMMDRNSGSILNVSSVAGWGPMPRWSVYAATKAFVLSFSEALAREVKGSGVKVTCFCPTVTQTLFFKRSNSENCLAYKRRMLLMDSETAAKQGYRALAKGKTCVIAGLTSSLMVFFLGRFAPRGVGIRMNQMLSRPA